MTPGCEVRTIVAEGEPWFVAADVAKILGYARAVDMTRYLEDDERGVSIQHTPVRIARSSSATWRNGACPPGQSPRSLGSANPRWQPTFSLSRTGQTPPGR